MVAYRPIRLFTLPVWLSAQLDAANCNDIYRLQWSVRFRHASMVPSWCDGAASFEQRIENKKGGACSMSQSIANKVYVVTGASRGFGLAIATDLVARGAKVGLLARDEDQLSAAVAQLGAEKALAVVADITDSSAVASAMAAVAAKFGGIDGLVNNAGIAKPGFVEQYTDAEVQAQLQINIAGVIYACRAAIPFLETSDNPRIINISSASAYHQDEMMGLSLYAASKAAVERLSRDLRREMQEKGVGVTILRPGAAATEFAAGWEHDRFVEALNAWHKRCGPYMDFGMGVEHVAEAVAFCLGMDPGVSVDELEIRPNRLIEKVKI